MDSDEYDSKYEQDESARQKVHEETCVERIKGATIGFLIAACLSVMAYTLLTILLPQNTECPMNRYSCRKEHFLKVYKSIQVVEKFRDTNRRKILSSVKAGLSERIFVPVLFSVGRFLCVPTLNKIRGTNEKEQMAEPPDEPLVILIMVESRIRSKEEFYPFVHSLVTLPRGQKFSTSISTDVKSATQFHNFLTDNLSQNKSVIVDDLNKIPASKVITGLYGLDYNSPSIFKVSRSVGNPSVYKT